MQRVSKSVWMAVALVAAVSAWMLTGLGRESEAPATAAPAAPAARVAIEVSRARVSTRAVTISARTEPNRVVELRAETEGRVVALGAERGAPVRGGTRIVGLDLRDREARQKEARGLIDYAELQWEAALKLKEKQFVSDTQMAELLSRVLSARAALEAIELEVANTTIAAPFDAVLQDRSVELGDYVNEGDTVAMLVDTDPLLVVGDLPERYIGDVAVGNTGTASLSDGTTVEGSVRYLAPVADAGTRTFRVELAVPNPSGALRAGVTAELKLAAEEVTAHLLSPALLTLADTGAVGVKTVDGGDRVEFHAVTIVESTPDGVLVTGLPHEVRLITVGQGYVRPGDTVIPEARTR